MLIDFAAWPKLTTRPEEDLDGGVRTVVWSLPNVYTMGQGQSLRLKFAVPVSAACESTLITWEAGIFRLYSPDQMVQFPQQQTIVECNKRSKQKVLTFK